MAQLTWDALTPIDTSKYLDAIQKAQAQSVAGVDQIGTAYQGYHDNLKKQNTNDMLTALNQAQNPEELAAAQANIAAMQQRWGSGYDMDAVRTAVDERPAVLNERASKALQYQHEKALHEAYPQINAAAAKAAAGLKGVTPEMAQELDALAALGIDSSGYIKGLGELVNKHFVTERTYDTGRADHAEEVKWREKQAKQAQDNWDTERGDRLDETDWNRADTVTKDHPAGNTMSFQDGKWVTITNPGISRTQAYGALSGVRGIRNNNPGNIDFYNQKGATLESKGGRFARFDTPEQGLNAMSKQLDLYFTGKSQNVTKPINTIQDIISTWAPPKNKKGQVENDTAAYIASVAKAMGVSPTAKLNLNDPNTKAALMSAMITHENGGNPYTQEQYIAGITGKSGTAGTAAAASNAIQIPQSIGAKAVSNYNIAITDLNSKFNLQTAQDQSKTAMGSKGQTIDSWVTSETTKDREGVTLFTDYSAKVAKLARNNAKLSNLPMDDQLRVLDAAHAWTLTSGGVITDKELNKQITNYATSLIDGKKNEHDQGKKNIFEEQYQAFKQELYAAGIGEISRDAFRQLVSPELAAKSTKVSVETPPASQSTKPEAKSGTVDNPFHSEPTSKPAPKATSQAASQAFIPFANLGVSTPKPVTSMTPKAVSSAAKPKPQAATPKAPTPKAPTPKAAAKPTKQDIVDYYVKKGNITNLIPEGLDAKKDGQLIAQAQGEARKLLLEKQSANAAKARKDAEAARAKKAAEKLAFEAKQRAELARVRKEYAELQKQKTANQQIKAAAKKAATPKLEDLAQLQRKRMQQKAKEEADRKRQNK